MLTPGGPAERLCETAGPQLYQHNAFRITGLSTDVTRRALRDFRQKVTLAADLGRPVERGELPLPVPATTEEILAALDDLLDPQRRIVHELFWFWDTPDTTCSCVSSLHADHDAAVRAHACVLDMELAAKHCSDAPPVSERQGHWVDAAARWCALLHRNAFWDHVRHRIEVLDDRRLDESTVDELRDTLPRALVTPVVDLAVQAPAPSWLVTQAERWQTGPHVVEDLLTEAAAPLLENVRTLNAEADQQHEAGQTRQAARSVQADVVPLLQRIDQLIPHHRNRANARARNNAAITLNNCALALMNRPGQAPTTEIRSFFDSAHSLVTDLETRRIIESNRAGLISAPTPAPPRAPGPASTPAGTRRPPVPVPASVGERVAQVVGGLIGIVMVGLLIGLPFILGQFLGGAGVVVGFGAWIFLYVLGVRADKRSKRGGH
ncbi:MAG: hypothetical protein ACR2GH_21995 [Pseudonocardia sp.]